MTDDDRMMDDGCTNELEEPAHILKLFAGETLTSGESVRIGGDGLVYRADKALGYGLTVMDDHIRGDAIHVIVGTS
jgi:hypothetical protein